MKRSPMPRGRRAKPRRSSAVVDHRYREFVRLLPCAAHRLGACAREVQFHHAAPSGLGQKCSDYDGIPLCDGHHDQWHDGGSGRPAAWGEREGRAEFAQAAIAATRAAWAAIGGVLIDPGVF